VKSFQRENAATSLSAPPATRDQLKRERQRRALELTAEAWRDDANPQAATQEAVEEELCELRSLDVEREARLEALR
jgi:hypothetical protein